MNFKGLYSLGDCGNLLSWANQKETNCVYVKLLKAFNKQVH